MHGGHLYFGGQARRQSDKEGSGETSCGLRRQLLLSMQIFLQWQRPVALELQNDDHVDTLRQAVQVTFDLCRLRHSSRCTR